MTAWGATLIAMSSESLLPRDRDPRPTPTPPPFKSPGPPPIVKPEATPTGTCLPPGVAKEARIVALGTYEGAGTTSLSMADSNHDVGSVAVAAASSGPPLVLVLSSYEATIWGLSGVPAHRLRAVFASGYYSQGITGVSPRVPIGFAAFRSRGGECGRATYAYEGGANLEKLAATVEIVTGRRIDAFQGRYRSGGFHIDGGTEPAPPVTIDPSRIRSSTAIGIDALRPRESGIRQLMAEGALRPADTADIAKLTLVLTRASPTGYLAPVRPERLRSGATYVVQSAVIMPRGMYGAHSRSFIVPAGVPMPVDPGSHNTYYRLDTGACTGPACPRD